MLINIKAETDSLKSVFVSTVPRTGSTWTFNVIRQLLRCSGHTVLPEKVPKNDGEMLQMAQTVAWYDQNPEKVWVLKVHAILKNHLPFSKIITCIRDPRDIIVSYRRFMKTSFSHALTVARSQTLMNELYLGYPDSYVFAARFEDIERCPEKLVLQLASFLNLDIPNKVAHDIISMFSRENTANLIRRKTAELDVKIRTEASIDDDEVVVLGQDNFRAYDVDTGFQAGHISSYKTGDWRDILTEQEKVRVATAFDGWLQKNGYPLD